MPPPRHHHPPARRNASVDLASYGAWLIGDSFLHRSPSMIAILMGSRRALVHLQSLWEAQGSHLCRPPRTPLTSPHKPYPLLRPTSVSIAAHFSRLFSSSAAAAVAEAYVDSSLCGNQELLGSRKRGKPLEEKEVARYIPVKAYFISTSIDLKSLQANNASNVIPPTSRLPNCVTLRYSAPSSKMKDMIAKKCASCFRHVVVFQYGSAVFFNIADHEAEEYINSIRKHACGMLPEIRKDDYAVVEKPLLDSWMQNGLDYITLKCLDVDGIRIIGNVLGQSIALDHFIRQVDDMVEEFTDINNGMDKTGTFTMERNKLFHLVGRANTNLADVIMKLGLFDRSEIAWRNANYAQILEYLKEEYELTQRFENLDYKLKFVEHNIHFSQKVLQNRKSNAMEWAIIVLIIIESIIMLYDVMSKFMI